MQSCNKLNIILHGTLNTKLFFYSEIIYRLKVKYSYLKWVSLISLCYTKAKCKSLPAWAKSKNGQQNSDFNQVFTSYFGTLTIDIRFKTMFIGWHTGFFHDFTVDFFYNMPNFNFWCCVFWVWVTMSEFWLQLHFLAWQARLDFASYMWCALSNPISIAYTSALPFEKRSTSIYITKYISGLNKYKQSKCFTWVELGAMTIRFKV